MKKLNHWQRHFAVVGGLASLIVVITVLIITQLVDLGSDSGLQLSHSDVQSDVLQMLWICFGAFTAIATLGAAFLRIGVLAIAPYVAGLGILPMIVHFLDKIY